MNRNVAARHEQRQQTRARLVEAALNVFAEQGYDHATVDEISIAAGYSKGAYYFHFNSKEDIFLELISNWIEEQNRRLGALGQARGSLAVALVETLESLLRYEGREHWRLLLPEIWAQSHRNARVRETIQAAYERWIALLEGALEGSAEEGLISLAVRPAVAASLILAAHDGLALRSRLKSATQGEPSSSQVVSALLSVILASPETPASTSISPTVRRTIGRKR